MDDKLYVGVARLELHVPTARSLKEKRSHTRGLAERIRHRHQVLIVEAGHQDLHQRSAFAVCAMSTSAAELEARLERVRGTVDDTWAGHVLAWEVEVFEV
jgi:hypothetical protein